MCYCEDTEVASMKWVREHIPDFPLPPVLAYQSDATRSDLDGCAEYILMGKVPGVPLQLLEPVPPPPKPQPCLISWLL